MTVHAPGSLVTARGRDWVVLADSVADMLVLRPLGGSDDDVAAVFPELETVSPARFAAPTAADLGDATSAGLLRTALRVGFRSAAGPFRSLAGIAVEPRAYQLVPLLMALRQETARLLIADDVGVGKTVEAGLIAAELLASGEAKGLAVLCSPALAEQWRDELRFKFGINAELVLASTVRKLERGLDLGQSLFDRYPHVIVSTDFIKSTRHRDDFVRHCPDLVIVDEAHGCVTTDDKPGKQQQQRYELMQRLSDDRQRHLLLLTATPHSGKTAAFRNLLGLLDPELASVDTDSMVGRRRLAQHFVQRRRADIRKYLDQDTEFPSDRLFKDETFQMSPAYRRLLTEALDYARGRVTDAAGRDRRTERIAWWSAIALLRSLVSSPRAAAQTLSTRSSTAKAATVAEADELGRPVSFDLTEDRLDGVDAAPGAATDDRAQTLKRLSETAQALEGVKHDTKLAVALKQVRGLLKEGYRPIVFCRYIPTAEYVAEHLAQALGKKVHVAAVTGTLSPQQRIQRIEELAALATEDPKAGRVLVATDCLSEGVNLQHHFDAIVHYDLAWNPTRHDQREGRVDRFGQKRDRVKVVTVYGSDNGIDGKVLDVLIKKHRMIRRDLGISVSVPDEASAGVTDAIVEWLLLQEGQAAGEQPMLAGLEQHVTELQNEWQSAGDREKASRSRFAQHAIHTDEVASELAEIRTVLGSAADIGPFVRHALTGLGGLLTEMPGGDVAADLSATPVGLRDALAAVSATDATRVVFRSSPAVPRGEVGLVRTDPGVAAIADFLLNSALDDQLPARERPARRCGVMRTNAVATRTTMLLVRFRFQLRLPSRYGVRELVAEDIRMVAFEGNPSKPVWLPDADAAELLRAEATVNTDPEFAERTAERVLTGLAGTDTQLNSMADRLAEELSASHRRVRSQTGQVRRGLTVTAQKPTDLLGVYVYLPAQTGAA
ncbi:SNF2 domain-containing protein [Stackebrandtia endophytica]|uniref:SNF2 domain-containing protein n=1 Tax=Stackebrandtia endophytica TaxID=1496996 RepID=A0A543ARC0_9ACTN|nr:DEAD/DEAH box helicase [Stackebrandtia endophytica]TQL75138.1 SNF2 domain-containing protein [Stackebrandtia endophytica]